MTAEAVIPALDLLRRTVANRPLWIFLALLSASLMIRHASRRRAEPRSLAFVLIASGAGFGYYLLVVVSYALVPQQSDYAEPTMTCVAWLFSIGKPVYRTIDSAERYAHMYGPMAFIVPGVVLRFTGPSMLAAKAVGSVAALLTLILMWRAVRSTTEAILPAFLACGLCVLEFLMFRNLTFWSRPEPLQLLAASGGLLAAARMKGNAALLVLAVSMGVLWNLKFTGPLYSLPILALFAARADLRSVTASVLGAGVVAILPFIIFPNVSWTDYLALVRLSAQNGLRVAALKENLEWGLFLSIPILARLSVPTPLPPSLPLMITALLLGVCGVIVAASKPGAGAYHLLPFLPSLAYVFAACAGPSTVRTRPMWLTPFVITVVFVALIQQQYFFRLTADPELADSYRDVEEYLTSHPAEHVGIGYTSAERMTFARTLVVFKTGEYLLDVPAIREHQLSGRPLPRATIEAVRSCSVDTWLVPSRGEPFHIRNDYPSTGHAEIFPHEFISSFYETYRLAGRTRHYNVWRCRGRE
jgi:hypothetical protein